MADIPLLDKELWEQYGKDEQEEAYDMLQDLKAQHDGDPTMLYINENEELQSYLMWFARMEDLTYEVTEGNTRVCQQVLLVLHLMQLYHVYYYIYYITYL